MSRGKVIGISGYFNGKERTRMRRRRRKGTGNNRCGKYSIQRHISYDSGLYSNFLGKIFRQKEIY